MQKKGQWHPVPAAAFLPGVPVKPLRLALSVAIVYFGVSAVYIVLSSSLAARLSVTVIDLETVEMIKGILFVLTTTLFLFLFAFFLFRRIARHEQRLEQYRDSLAAAERRAAAGLFAASVAHDINNILTVIDLGLSELSARASEGKEERAARLNLAIGQLRDLSRRLSRIGTDGRVQAPSTFDLAAAIRETLDLAQTHHKVRFCRVTLLAPDRFPFFGHTELIDQMLINLLLNAADATGNAGRIEVRLQRNARAAVLQVHDDGAGVGTEMAGTIMEPFVTTKKDGSGLGLLSVKACAEAHNGRVRVSRSELGGACFEVTLAGVRPPRAETAGPAPASLRH